MTGVEKQSTGSSRRSFMKLAAAAPLFVAMGGRSLAETVTTAVKSAGRRSYSDNLYTRLGVRPLINGCGTWTYLRLCGAKLAVAQTLDDVPRVLNDQTAMVYTTWRDDRLPQLLKITKPAGVPVLLDDAAGIPPFDNMRRYAQIGVDMYCFSGGKGLCGPQVSGLLIGRKDLIDAAMANNDPWEGAVCRPMKVGKEEIMGVLAAVEYWSHADLAALNKEWRARVVRIQKLVETVPGITMEIAIPMGGNSYPTLTVNWDEQKWNLTVTECAQQLRDGEPRIEVLTDSNPSGVLARLHPAALEGNGKNNKLQIVSMTLQPGEDLIVGNRLRQVLNKARKASA